MPPTCTTSPRLPIDWIVMRSSSTRAGYLGIAKGPEMAVKTTGFRVVMKPGERMALAETPEGRLENLLETAHAHIRSQVEHLFRVIKQHFGVQKTRLRGQDKNRCKVDVLAPLKDLLTALRSLF